MRAGQLQLRARIKVSGGPGRQLVTSKGNHRRECKDSEMSSRSFGKKLVEDRLIDRALTDGVEHQLPRWRASNPSQQLQPAQRGSPWDEPRLQDVFLVGAELGSRGMLGGPAKELGRDAISQAQSDRDPLAR